MYEATYKDGVYTWDDKGYNRLKLSKIGLYGEIGNIREGGGFETITLQDIVNGNVRLESKVLFHIAVEDRHKIETEIIIAASKLLEAA